MADLGAVGRAMTDTEVALATAEAGAAVVRARYGADLQQLAKSATDFATAADLEAEEAIRRVIRQARPEDAFEGEETGTSAGSNDRRWLVDPLCGTLNFAAVTPLAAVNIALVTPAGVTAAVSADPIADELFWTDGVAAWARRAGQDRPLVPSAASLILDVNCDAKGEEHFVGGQLIADAAVREAFAVRVLSSTLAVAWVAAGRRAAYVTDGWLEGSVHFAAGIALCQAAGCIVTDLTGGALHRGRGMIAAADAETHARVLALVGPHLTARRAECDHSTRRN